GRGWVRLHALAGRGGRTGRRAHEGRAPHHRRGGAGAGRPVRRRAVAHHDGLPGHRRHSRRRARGARRPRDRHRRWAGEEGGRRRFEGDVRDERRHRPAALPLGHQAVAAARRRSSERSAAAVGSTSSPPTEMQESLMAEIEIGLGKTGRRAYGFDDIAIVPSRRTRDPEDVDISWEIDAFQFELPLLASAVDGVVSPATAVEIGRLGGAGVLNLEGLWTRYEDPEPYFEEI